MNQDEPHWPTKSGLPPAPRPLLDLGPLPRGATAEETARREIDEASRYKFGLRPVGKAISRPTLCSTCRRRTLRGRNRRGILEAMTAPQSGSPPITDRPACSPAAIRAVLAANADPDILQHYDDELDAAFEQARHDQDLTALVQTVRRWWFEADAWRDPDTQRQFLARMDRYQTDGPPLPHQRVSREEIRTRYGI